MGRTVRASVASFIATAGLLAVACWLALGLQGGAVPDAGHGPTSVAAADRLATDVATAAAALRAVLVDGRPAAVAVYRQSAASAQATLAGLGAMADGDPARAALLATIDEAATRQLEAMAGVLALALDGRRDAAVALDARTVAVGPADPLQASIAELAAFEDRRLDRLQAAAARARTRRLALSGAFLLLALAMAAGAGRRSYRRHRQALRDLDRSRNRLRLLAESSTDLILRAGRDGRILFASAAASDLVGQAPAALIGQSVADLVHPDDRALVLNEQALLERGEGGAPVSFRLQRGDDGLWVEATATLLAEPETGAPVEVILIIRDISGHKALEQELRRAQRAAEAANAAKNAFLARMSHELRTPMNAVIGFAELALMGGKGGATGVSGARREEWLQLILNASRFQLQLVNDVLDLAKIEAGVVTLAIEPVEIGAAVDDVLALLGPAAAQADVTLRREVAPGIAPGGALGAAVLADPTRLRQVLTNLCSNAIKYNLAGGSVTVAAQPADGGWRIEVRDTGIGIPAALADRVFQPFERLGREHGTTDGSGIGLALTRHLVTAMAGRIGFDSVAGQGTTFWCELPAAPAPAGDRRRVLYIEDQPANQALLKRLVATIPGVELIAAETAEVGLELAARHRPDLILLDLNLPGMDGYAALTRLQRMPETRDTPVFALSVAATPREIARGLKAGFARYLTKPFEIRAMIETLQQALFKDAAADQSTGTHGDGA